MVLIPTAAVERMQECLGFLHALWRGHVIFGVWQEDCLDRLPQTTRLLLCPLGCSQESQKHLENLKAKGVEVLPGAGDAWRLSPRLQSAAVRGGDALDLLTRRTREGRLYALFAEQAVGSITLEMYGRTRVQLDVTDFALIHERAAGIGLIEGHGGIRINDRLYCEVSGSRLLLAAGDELPLDECAEIEILPSGPCRVRFTRDIARATVYQPGINEPFFWPIRPGSCELEIDEQLCGYGWRLTLVPTNTPRQQAGK